MKKIEDELLGNQYEKPTSFIFLDASFLITH